MKAETTFSLKDQLFNAEKVEYLSSRFSSAYPGFDGRAFRAEVVKAFPRLELKERITHITECLRVHLPDEFVAAVEIILDALPPELDSTRTDDDFGDFIFAPLSHYVATYGCSGEHLEASLDALREITKRFSAESAIRYFINAFPERSMEFMHECAEDDHYHVRRLASEGSRPKLPWARKIDIDYREPLPILEKLYDDPTRYVTRSVANHLNDISKLDATLVVETLRRWNEELDQIASEPASDKARAELLFVTTHALRTLVKAGNADAMELLGFSPDAGVTVHAFAAETPVVKIGGALEFVLEIESETEQGLLVDYAMQFAAEGGSGGGGGGGGRKVFKLKKLQANAGERIEIKKKHPLRLMTTRRLFPGTHTVTLQINGRPADSFSFELVV